MIVDAHTHTFPESILERRVSLADDDAAFATLYRDPRATMATAGELLAAMDEDGVRRAAVAGITWQRPEYAIEHNTSLLAAAGTSGARLIALCCVPIAPPRDVVAEMERCAASGARGFGELRLDWYAAFDPALRHVIAETAARLGLPLLLHASEPVGHAYAGKDGGGLESVWTFLAANPDLTVILAHLGGGLPFFGHMPEVRERLQSAYVDTAAAPWLYEPAAVRLVVDLIGAERVLFGSDFPLRHPRRDLAWLHNAGLSDADLGLILGHNALRVFNLTGK